MSDTVARVVWFDRRAEEAANFYVSLLPDSHVDAVHRAPADYPSGKKGDVLTIEFTLAGRQFVGLNGGPHFTFNEAVSFQIYCDDQAEVDRLTAALSAVPARPSNQRQGANLSDIVCSPFIGGQPSQPPGIRSIFAGESRFGK